MPSRRDATALTILLVPYLWLVRTFWFVCDDAFITFRYSRNWALGHGPRYNLGDHTPVEGYSNFLWMALASWMEAFQADVAFWIPLLSTLCGVVLIALVYRTLRVRAELDEGSAFAVCLIMACFPPVAVWSSSGLATMPQALFMFATFLLIVDSEHEQAALGAGMTGLMLALTRTEGIAWCIVFGLLAVVNRYLRGRPILHPLGVYGSILAIGYGSYFAWRFGYYESLVANTALAKVHMQPSTLERGMRYIGLYATTMVVPLLMLVSIPVGLMSRRRALALTVGAMALGVPAYGVAVSGDYMTYFRILMPGVAFMVVSFGLAMRALQEQFPLPAPAWWTMGGLVALLGLLPTADIYVFPQSVRASLQVRDKLDYFRDENKQWKAMVQHTETWREKGQALAAYAKRGETYVAAAIGNTGYYSDLFIYDRNGLVNREVAEQPWNGVLRSPGHDKVVDRSFFFSKEPDILDAKVIEGPRLDQSARSAMKKMEAMRVKRLYYPDLFELQGAPFRKGTYLLALRRAKGPQHAQRMWDAYREALASLSRPRAKKTEATHEP